MNERGTHLEIHNDVEQNKVCTIKPEKCKDITHTIFSDVREKEQIWTGVDQVAPIVTLDNFTKIGGEE